MAGKKNQRHLRSNNARGNKILKNAHIIARRNALYISESKTNVETVDSNICVPKNCPLKGCDSFGHLNGINSQHITLSGCPLFHNVTMKYCQEMREREEGLAPGSQLNFESSKKRPIGQIFNLREPRLDELANSVHIYQFRRAQQKLVSDKDKEVQEHLIMCAKLQEFETKSSSPLIAVEKGTGEGESLPDPSKNPIAPTANSITDLVFGDWQMKTWYSSMYPPQVACLPLIYICEYCLIYMQYNIAYRRHRLRCKRKFPPGNEIYRRENLSFFEIDGNQQKEYCRNLCLLAKLYLKQKTVHELDLVSAFLFYILTEADESGCHIVGYFSKHKPEEQDVPSTASFNNLSCLLIMPHHQKKGFGQMLVEFSYLLSRVEGRVGTPERPLSDQGLLVYQRYWRRQVVSFLCSYESKEINLNAISDATGMFIRDIVSTFLDLGLLKYIRTEYYIVNDKEAFKKILLEMREPEESRRIDPTCLHWLPPKSSLDNADAGLSKN